MVRRSAETVQCEHIVKINPDISGNTKGCEECEKLGSGWVKLRLCLSCGHVGCCDSSPNKHATKHFKHSRHPIIKSYEPGENWKWCYVDETYLYHQGYTESFSLNWRHVTSRARHSP